MNRPEMPNRPNQLVMYLDPSGLDVVCQWYEDDGFGRMYAAGGGIGERLAFQRVVRQIGLGRAVSIASRQALNLRKDEGWVE